MLTIYLRSSDAYKARDRRNALGQGRYTVDSKLVQGVWEYRLSPVIWTN